MSQVFFRELGEGNRLLTAPTPEVTRDVLGRLERAVATVPAPPTAPGWEVVVLDGDRTRVVHYWHDADLISEQAAAEPDYRVLPADARLLDGLAPALAATEVPFRSDDVPAASSRFSGAIPHLGLLIQGSDRAFRGQIVGVSECYYERAGSRFHQWTSYLVEVQEDFKPSRNRPGRYVRLRWPGGYLDGGQTRGFPLLQVGGTYLFFTTWALRAPRDEAGQRRLEDHHESGVIFEGWGGWMGFGLLRIRDGFVVPAFDHVEAELAASVQAGNPVPVMNEFDGPFPAWGLPWAEYRRHLLRILKRAATPAE